MRSPAQHPSRLGSTGGLDLDLGLAPSAPKPVVQRTVDATTEALPEPSRRAASSGPSDGLALGPPLTPAPPVPVPPKALAADDDDDDDWDGGGPLDIGLDYGSEAPPPMSAPAMSAPPSLDVPADPPSGIELGGPPSAPQSRAPAPSSARLSPGPVGEGAPRFSPEEIEAVAQYGPPPDNVLLSPMYALRVFRHRRTLVERLEIQKRTHAQVSSNLRSRLADVVDGIVAAAPDPAQVEGVMGAIRTAEQKIADRKVQLEAASGQFASQFKSIQGQLEAEATQRQQLDRDRNMAQIRVEDAVHKRAQVAAELKRVNVDIEAAHDAATRAAGADADFAPPEHARRITELDAKRAKLTEQVRGRDKAVADARAELKQRERALTQLDARVQAIHVNQRQMEQQAGEAQNMGLGEVKRAQEERLVAYEVALEAVEREAAGLIDSPTKAQIVDVRRQIEQCDADLKKFELAVDAYDSVAYKRGVAMVIGVAVIVLLALISAARVQ